MEQNSEDPTIDHILSDLLQRLDRGESIDPEEFLQEHPKHVDQLREFFENERLLKDSRKDETERFDSRDTPAHMLQVRCPHCRTPNPIAVDTPLDKVLCESCGGSFHLAGDNSKTRRAPSMTTVGHFELIERIGIGGFGSVWKARDTELDRAVAIKIPRQGQMDAEEIENFFREARAAAQLKHPNIVAVHEVGRDGDAVYIVCELVRGITLSDWLTGQNPTSREAAELCLGIADALHHAHENGVIHRDLKPSNIMIDREGEPHLMDFGLARREVGEVTVTTDGQVLGTPAYMSPEQAEGRSHTADRRTDVYSMGVILFKLLTGELPFRGNARMQMYQILHEEPRKPRTLNDRVPRDLEMICLKAMSKEPNHRYSTAAEMAEDLRRYLSHLPVEARPLGYRSRVWRWCRRPQRLRDAGAFSVFLALLLIAWGCAGIVFTLFLNPSDRPRESFVQILVLMIFYYVPLLWIGLQTLRRRLYAVWLGLFMSTLALCLCLIFCFQDYLGFELDMGGVYATPEVRAPVVSLLSLLCAIMMFVYVFGLIAYYSNRNTMRRYVLHDLTDFGSR